MIWGGRTGRCGDSGRLPGEIKSASESHSFPPVGQAAGSYCWG
jgi:hypothetical protein